VEDSFADAVALIAAVTAFFTAFFPYSFVLRNQADDRAVELHTARGFFFGFVISLLVATATLSLP